MSGPRHLVADDYGLSPAVSRGIRSLIAAGRLSGTGCMTLFPEWGEEAGLLKATANVGAADIGQHLTLTDFPGLAGFSLDGSGRMPPLRHLIATLATTDRHDRAIRDELDAQLAAFETDWGRAPAYLDGHQHVHFLRPVRQWLKDKAGQFPARPWLRGAPAMTLATGVALKAKIGFVAMLARGFDGEMRAAGYPVRGPLAGFYDWRRPDTFEAALEVWAQTAPPGSVVMCHPGEIDDLLESRDSLVAARAVELEILAARPPLFETARQT